MILFLILFENLPILFFILAAPTVHKGSDFSISSTTFVILWFFDGSHPMGIIKHRLYQVLLSFYIKYDMEVDGMMNRMCPRFDHCNYQRRTDL